MWVRFQVDFASVNICEDIVPIGSLCDRASKRSWVWIPPMGRVKHKYTNKKIFLFYLTGDGDVTSELAPVETNCPFNGHFTFTFSRQMSSLNVNSAEDACNRKSFYLNNCPGSIENHFLKYFDVTVFYLLQWALDLWPILLTQCNLWLYLESHSSL